ncbi:MAG: vWA domain-containing protein [Deferrisomatales bacterium]|nr:vWA domain-containing protein [Deferrisomatales bacterium]
MIALVIDVSGSMAWRLDSDQPAGLGETSRMDVAKEAAKLFVDSILGDDQTDDLIALVSFSSDARILTSLTNDGELLKTRIDGLAPQGATNFGAAFSEAVKAVGIYPGKRAVVFLTDGEDTVDLGTDTLPLFSWPDWGTAAKRNHSLRWEALHKLLDYELVSYTIGFGPVAFDVDAAEDLRAFAGDPTLAVPPPEGYPVGRYYSAPTAEDLLDAFDPQSPDSIPARIGVLPGIRSPYVSFVNDYHDPAGPIDAIVTLWFENANGNLYSSARGTYIVP